MQNKLHRSADPGDLRTCEELIGRVRAGQYSEGFRSEFEIFYEELKEFFNATGLDKRLQQVASQLGTLREDIQGFLGKKSRGEAGVAEVTTLRRKLATIDAEA